MTSPFSTVTLVLNKITPCVEGGDCAALYAERLSSLGRKTRTAEAEALISVALGAALPGRPWTRLTEEVDQIVREQSLHTMSIKRLNSLLKITDPDSDGWGVVIACLVAYVMVTRGLSIEQDIDMWGHLYDYWEMGLPVVPQNGKAPIVTGWPEYAYKMPTERTVDGWRVDQFDGIGLVLGPVADLCVVDIDVRDRHDGREAWPIDPRHPHLVRTPSGGFHLYYIRSGHKGLTWLGDGVELLGDEKLVSLPPSRGAYRWINCDWKSIGLLNLGFRTLADSKPEFHEDNRKPGKIGKGWMRKIATIRDAATEGQRVEAGVSFAGYLIHRGARDVEDIENTLRTWNQRNEPPLTDGELEGSVFTCIESFIERAA